jgi:parallel beta-helix repeat protein
VSSNALEGIGISSSSNVQLSNVTSILNGEKGFHIENVQNSSFKKLFANHNPQIGLHVQETNYTNFTDITAHHDFAGIQVTFSSDYNKFTSLNVYDNTYYGLYIESSSKNRFQGTLANNGYASINGLFMRDSNFTVTSSGSVYGIILRDSDSNIVTGSYITGSVGVYLDKDSLAPASNLIYNNYFNNTANVRIDNGILLNHLNTTRQPGANIIGGTLLGGNFYSNPAGTGFSQTCIDDGGICTTDYNITNGSSTITDYEPLAKPSCDDPDLSSSCCTAQGFGWNSQISSNKCCGDDTTDNGYVGNDPTPRGYLCLNDVWYNAETYKGDIAYSQSSSDELFSGGSGVWLYRYCDSLGNGPAHGSAIEMDKYEQFSLTLSETHEYICAGERFYECAAPGAHFNSDYNLANTPGDNALTYSFVEDFRCCQDNMFYNETTTQTACECWGGEWSGICDFSSRECADGNNDGGTGAIDDCAECGNGLETCACQECLTCLDPNGCWFDDDSWPSDNTCHPCSDIYSCADYNTKGDTAQNPQACVNDCSFDGNSDRTAYSTCGFRCKWNSVSKRCEEPPFVCAGPNVTVWMNCSQLLGNDDITPLNYWACNNHSYDKGTGPAVRGCCANSNRCVKADGSCVTGDFDYDTAEMEDITYGDMTCHMGKWCPVGFEYDSFYGRCKFMHTPCYSNPVHNASNRYCDNLMFTEGWWDDLDEWWDMTWAKYGGKNRDCFFNQADGLSDRACTEYYIFDNSTSAGIFYEWEDISTY